MKKRYITPCVKVLMLQDLTPLLADSDNVINPGAPNTPAGARSFSDTDWEEEW